MEHERRREQQREQAHERDREQERERLAEFRRQKEEGLAEKQAPRRLEEQQAEQQLFTRQQAERLALHAAQESESRGFLFRVRSAVADLIRRTPGLRSVLSHIQKKAHLDPKERHRLENEALARHAREKRDIERRRRTLDRLETRERHSLEKAVKPEQRLQEAARLERERTAGQARTVENKAMQGFFEAKQRKSLGISTPQLPVYARRPNTATFNAAAALAMLATDRTDSAMPSRRTFNVSLFGCSRDNSSAICLVAASTSSFLSSLSPFCFTAFNSSPSLSEISSRPLSCRFPDALQTTISALAWRPTTIWSAWTLPETT
jgi:hypothetical protein